MLLTQGERRAARRADADQGSAMAMGMRRFVKQMMELWRGGFDSQRVLMTQVGVFPATVYSYPHALIPTCKCARMHTWTGVDGWFLQGHGSMTRPYLAIQSKMSFDLTYNSACILINI